MSWVDEREQTFFQRYRITLTYTGDQLTKIEIYDKDTKKTKTIELTYTAGKLTQVDMEVS